MWKMKATGVFIVLLAAFGFSGCGGSTSGSNTGGEEQASVFTVGTDAPLPSVVSCQIMVTGVTINNGTTNVPVLTTPQVVDFAQLSGLHQLLDLNSVPTGTYTSATVTLASPVIGFIDTTQSPPAINTIDGTLTQSSVTVNFANPFVLNAADLVGLRMEFDLRQSLQTDQNGQVTGTVNPVFNMQLLNATDANVSIDDFHAGVVGVTGDNTFTVQGPKGRQWTVQTNSSTVLDDPSIPVSSFTTNTIVEISGQLDPVSHDIDASEIEVVSNDKFVLGGLFTSIRPPSGPATQADLYVRYELPDVTGIQDGQIETLALNGSEIYKIANINNPITTLIFNNSALAPGQVVDVAGSLQTTNGVSTLTVHRVVLRRQGQEGTWVPGSTVVQNGNSGSFQLTDDWTAGILLPSPLTVLTTNATNFINLSGLSGLSGSQALPLRVVGFILINPATNQPVMVARSVEQLPSTD
ncbi:MAG TPA: DUF5666 domain-containing protein [Candidatus Baltobacteraceae bacterium]|nr:DUF5666 domain-containing protein [Candidatus Baltobacteraceae bacterium]